MWVVSPYIFQTTVTKVTTGTMTRIVIRCDDRETRVKWRNLTNMIDDEADYEEIVQGLVDYFDEEPSRTQTVRRKIRGPKYR